MRRTINISLPNEMYDFVAGRAGNGPVSEYIRALIRAEQLRIEDRAKRPVVGLLRASDAMGTSWVVGEIMHLAKRIEDHDW